MGRQRIEHKRVVGIGGMREFDLDGLFFGLRGCLCTGHGLIQFLLTARLRGSRLSNNPSRSFGFSRETLPPRESLLRNGKERTFATLGLAWRGGQAYFRTAKTSITAVPRQSPPPKVVAAQQQARMQPVG